MICRAAKHDGYIAEDPAEFVETVRKSSEQARRPFTTSEIQRVISVADVEWKSLILFGLYTGQRLADVATLTWDHVDLSRNEIRLKTRKTAKRLTIPIAAPLRTHLDSLAVAGECGSPIHRRAFGTMRRQGKSGNLSNQFSDILAKPGLRQKAPHKGRGARITSYELRFHSLRHYLPFRTMSCNAKTLLIWIGNCRSRRAKPAHITRDSLVPSTDCSGRRVGR
jgi:integrase